MSGGDGIGHNSGAYFAGGVKGSAGPGGPSSGGASDHSGWSSENTPWGGGNSGSGVHWGEVQEMATMVEVPQPEAQAV